MPKDIAQKNAPILKDPLRVNPGFVLSVWKQNRSVNFRAETKKAIQAGAINMSTATNVIPNENETGDLSRSIESP